MIENLCKSPTPYPNHWLFPTVWTLASKLIGNAFAIVKTYELIIRKSFISQ